MIHTPKDGLPKMTESEVKKLEACLAHFKVKLDQFNSGTKVQEVADCRHCFWIVLRLSSYGWSAIAKLTGHDHKTVMNGCSEVRRAQLKHDLQQIKEALQL